jgi:prepilin-type N-terminal cleavage/methylation domain-containing protein
MDYNKNNKGFTLIEIMVWIIIVSIVLVWWFQALFAIAIWKTRLMNETDLQKESFYFTEKLFEMIKKGWTIDYEEYFNRKVIWNTTTSSWHYNIASWFWNFWSWGSVWSIVYWDNFYYCRSWNWIVNKMTWSWCYNNALNNYWSSFNWKQQRYWEFSFQFIDYNSNYDNDLWNEDNDGSWNIIWDDDDEYLWLWPNTFSWWIDLRELYLISWNKKERTYFRWNVKKDPYAPPWSTCNTNNQVTWTWCLWTIEYLKLDWKDWWMSHNLSNTSDKTLFDWVIDTWLVNPDFVWWSTQVAWIWTVEWIPLFPDNINVSEFKIYGYPNNDVVLNWKNYNENLSISPYVIIKMKIKPSWLSRKKIKWSLKDLDFSMTINLSDIYSQ